MTSSDPRPFRLSTIAALYVGWVGVVFAVGWYAAPIVGTTRYLVVVVPIVLVLGGAFGRWAYRHSPRHASYLRARRLFAALAEGHVVEGDDGRPVVLTEDGTYSPDHVVEFVIDVDEDGSPHLRAMRVDGDEVQVEDDDDE